MRLGNTSPSSSISSDEGAEQLRTQSYYVSAIGFVILMFLGAYLGGLWGERYHRRADEVVASREGGLTRPMLHRDVP